MVTTDFLQSKGVPFIRVIFLLRLSRMAEDHASHMASLIVRLLSGEGPRHVPTEAEIAECVNREKVPFAEYVELKRTEVKKFSVGDRVQFPIGGQRGLLLYGVVDKIHEMWVSVLGDDGSSYVCPAFSGIQKMKQ